MAVARHCACCRSGREWRCSFCCRECISALAKTWPRGTRTSRRIESKDKDDPDIKPIAKAKVLLKQKQSQLRKLLHLCRRVPSQHYGSRNTLQAYFPRSLHYEVDWNKSCSSWLPLLSNRNKNSLSTVFISLNLLKIIAGFWGFGVLGFWGSL